MILEKSFPGEVPEQVRTFLESDELLNNVPLGFLNRVLKNPDSFPNFRYFYNVNQSKTDFYGHMLPKFPLALSSDPFHRAGELASYLREKQYSFDRMHSISSVGERFLKSWPEKLNLVEATDVMGFYKLTEVISARPTGGVLDLARSSDSSFLIRCRKGFDRETDSKPATNDEIKSWLQVKLKEGSMHVLRIQDRCVATATIGRQMKTAATIGFVYTPPELRGKGYASDIVAQLSQKILDSGKSSVCLFTQMKNPTSNGIYKRIGYVWAEEFSLMTFSNHSARKN